MKSSAGYKIEAVVLGARDAKEVDRVYTFFTREFGKMKAMGRGVRKVAARLASGLEPITLSEIFLVEGRRIDKITGVIIADQYPGIKKDLEQIRRVKTLFDILDKIMPEKEAADEVFHSLIFWLDAAEKGGKSELLRLAVAWKAIKWSGLHSQMFSCSCCNEIIGTDKDYWFYPETGIVCLKCYSSACGKGMKISKDMVKLLRIFTEKDIELVGKIVASAEIIRRMEQLTIFTLSQVLQRRVYF